jgi:undecaprenyl-diphosphatase
VLRRDRALELLWTVALALFTAMAAGAALFDRFPADERIAHAVQAIDVPVFAGFIDLVNWLGNPWPGAALALLIAACCALARAPVAAVLVLLTFLAKWANSGLQELIDRPRPSPQLVDVTKQVGTASFPSGHTVGTTVVFGLLFLLLPTLVHPRAVRWPLQGACLLLIAAAGPARVYIGVHWPSDVLGGYLLAALFLLPLAAAYRSGKAEESR